MKQSVVLEFSVTDILAILKPILNEKGFSVDHWSILTVDNGGFPQLLVDGPISNPRRALDTKLSIETSKLIDTSKNDIAGALGNELGRKIDLAL